MSDIIKLLPDSVANQIAAGEVIQRPASVIKELVENAIDAGATKIQLVLKDPGRPLIQVIENGMGMSETDARLAFERHSTSKITCADDLFSLHTMGFRGEALASIAAIAQVEQRTTKRGEQMGTKICISGSKCESQTPDFCPEGCNFMIKNIFFNVPARRKFLKKDPVELSNVVKEFEKLALINFPVEFTLIHNGTTMFQLMGGDTFKSRIIALFSKSLEKQLIPLDAETTVVKINGYIGRPENARKRNALQYMFVNGRYMKHPYFHKAILSAYDQLIPSDEQPNYFLNFKVDPHNIDVNIHPTKSEIKFEDEQVIWQIIYAAAKEALGRFSAVPSIEFDMEHTIEIPVEGISGSNNVAQPQIEVNTSYNPFDDGRTQHYSKSPSKTGTFVSKFERHADANLKNWDPRDANVEKSVEEATTPKNTDTPESGQTATMQSQLFESDSNSFLHGGVIQLRNKYILTSGLNGILLVDQFRAHTRTLYDKLLSNSQNKTPESQRVMFPEVVNLSSAQSLIMEDLQQEMENMGFELSFLGNGSWSVNSIPANLKGVDIKSLILDVTEAVVSGGNSLSKKLAEHIALSSARRAAIQYGKPLTTEEMERILNDLFQAKESKYTPDGKLIIAEITFDEIGKLFS